MNPKRRIALLSRDRELTGLLELRLGGRGYQVVTFSDPSQVLGFIFSDPPDLMLIDLVADEPAFSSVLRELKQDSCFAVLPVIGLIQREHVEAWDWSRHPLDDFVIHPIDYPELFSRIHLSFQRLQRIFDNNPLTKLPGNVSIQRAIEQSLGEAVAVCYIDINNFKPYNDTFGFTRGDEVIRMVARIMSNTVREHQDGGFVGHIGGDDFVFITSRANAETVCQAILDRFSIIVSDLFGDEDKERGYYTARDRKGDLQQIPLLGISIAVVPMDNPLICHTAKVSEVAAELKKLAKKSQKSCYVMDRRRTRS